MADVEMDQKNGEKAAEETRETDSSTQVEPNASHFLLQLTPRDTQDPSYSQLELPYRVICRERLLRKAQEMRDQFFQELRHDELFQNRALDGVRVHREFCSVATAKKGKAKQTLADYKRLEQLMNEQF